MYKVFIFLRSKIFRTDFVWFSRPPGQDGWRLTWLVWSDQTGHASLVWLILIRVPSVLSPQYWGGCFVPGEIRLRTRQFIRKIIPSVYIRFYYLRDFKKPLMCNDSAWDFRSGPESKAEVAPKWSKHEEKMADSWSRKGYQKIRQAPTKKLKPWIRPTVAQERSENSQTLTRK